MTFLLLFLFGTAASIQNCTLGNYAVGNDCTPCRPGTFADGYGSEKCEDCPKGTFSLTGASSCDTVFTFNVHLRPEVAPTNDTLCDAPEYICSSSGSLSEITFRRREGAQIQRSLRSVPIVDDTIDPCRQASAERTRILFFEIGRSFSVRWCFHRKQLRRHRVQCGSNRSCQLST